MHFRYSQAIVIEVNLILILTHAVASFQCHSKSIPKWVVTGVPWESITSLPTTDHLLIAVIYCNSFLYLNLFQDYKI